MSESISTRKFSLSTRFVLKSQLDFNATENEQGNQIISKYICGFKYERHHHLSRHFSLHSICAEKQTEKSLKELGSNSVSEFFILSHTLRIHFLCLQRDVSRLLQISTRFVWLSSLDWKKNETSRRTIRTRYLFNKSEKWHIKRGFLSILSLPISYPRVKTKYLWLRKTMGWNYLLRS